MEAQKLDILPLADELTRKENTVKHALKLQKLEEEKQKNKFALLFSALNSVFTVGSLGCDAKYVCDRVVGSKSEFHMMMKVISWTQIYLIAEKIVMSLHFFIGQIF